MFPYLTDLEEKRLRPCTSCWCTFLHLLFFQLNYLFGIFFSFSFTHGFFLYQVCVHFSLPRLFLSFFSISYICDKNSFLIPVCQPSIFPGCTITITFFVCERTSSGSFCQPILLSLCFLFLLFNSSNLVFFCLEFLMVCSARFSSQSRM